MCDTVAKTLPEWRRQFDAVADLALTGRDGETELRAFMGKSLSFKLLVDSALDGELRRYRNEKEVSV